MEKHFDLRQACGEKVVIAAHRGVMGGNIAGNTIDAFEAALVQGADMLELDISRSADGVLYVFHPGMEPVFLRSQKLITDMHSSEVDQLVFHNADATPTCHHVMRFDDMLEHYKDRCYLNIDKFWMWPGEIAEAIRRQGMTDQVLVKTPAEEKYFEQVEQLAPDMPFMTIAWDKDEVSERLLRRKLNFAGLEVLFASDDKPIASPEYIDWMHKNNLIVWANAIVYNYRAVLAGGHNDDISVVGRADEGWGWLADRGFDIIQTDWPLPMIQHLEKTNRLMR